MRLHEFEAANIFEATGIPIPRRGVAGTVEEALLVAGEIGYPVMLKSQVLVGGRGLAGGIKAACNEEELKEILQRVKARKMEKGKAEIHRMAEEMGSYYEDSLNFPLEVFWDIAKGVLKKDV